MSHKYEELLFTPYAWAKMLFLRDASKNEVSGFGVTPRFLNLIEDIAVPKQTVQPAYVDIDDTGLAIMCDELAQKGLQPNQFMRIWIHTHPAGCGATPSGQDEKCLKESFSDPDWAVMMILSQNGATSCRLQVNKPFSIAKEIPIKTVFHYSFPASDEEAWKAEYKEKVSEKTYVNTHTHVQAYGHGNYAHNNSQSIMQQSNWDNWGLFPQYRVEEVKLQPTSVSNAFTPTQKLVGEDAKKIAIKAGYAGEMAKRIEFVASYFFLTSGLAMKEILELIEKIISPNRIDPYLIKDEVTKTAVKKTIGSKLVLTAEILNIISEKTDYTGSSVREFLVSLNHENKKAKKKTKNQLPPHQSIQEEMTPEELKQWQDEIQQWELQANHLYG